MNKIKRVIRLCSLILFMVLALAGIGLLGVAPTLNRDRKLFADTESSIQVTEEDEAESDDQQLLS